MASGIRDRKSGIRDRTSGIRDRGSGIGDRKPEALSGLIPDPRSLIPDPLSGLIPDPRSLIPDVRSPIPDVRSLIPDPRSRRSQRGGVFVIALAVLAGLVAVVVSIAATQRAAYHAATNRIEARRAEIAAFSGLQRALAEFATQDANIATQQDAWAVLSQFGQERFVVGTDDFRLEVVDASGFMNLNTIDEDQLRNLPLTTEQIDSILDWRSSNRDPRPEGGKDEFYNNLSVPYNAKLGNFDSVDELLLVRGFTPAVLYEVQTDIVSTSTITQGNTQAPPILAEILTADSQSSNTTATGETKLNINSNTVTMGALIQRGFPPPLALELTRRRPYATLGQVLQAPGVNSQNAALILDNLTLAGGTQQTGKINVNTAPETVLAAIPGMQPDLAAALVSRQQTPLQSLGELLAVPGFSLQVLQQTADRFTVGSQTFIARIEGRAGRARHLLEATISLENGAVRVLKVRRPPFADMTARWGWDATPTNDVIITENP